MKLNGIIQIWKNKGIILEGVVNSVFKTEHIEEIAAERLSICMVCESYDLSGEGCFVPGTAPCCSNLNDGCGCSLKFATRSLSKECPKNKWPAFMSYEEEELLKSKMAAGE